MKQHTTPVIRATLATVLTVVVAAPTATATAESSSSSDTTCSAVHVVMAPGTSETSTSSNPNDDRHGYLSELIRPVLSSANDGTAGSDLSGGFSKIITDNFSESEEEDSTTDAEESTSGWGSSNRSDSSDSDDAELNVARTTLTYPSTAGGAWAGMGVTNSVPKNFGDTTPYAQSVSIGVGMAEEMISQISSDCPDTDIVLIGYSQGAEVMSATARRAGAGVSDVPADAVAGVALIADPTREAGTPLMADGSDAPVGQSAVSGLGEYPTPKAAGLGNEKTGISDFGSLSDRVFSACLPGDYVCGLPAESELVAEVVTTAEQLSLGDPVDALTQVAKALDRVAKTTEIEDVADLDFGEDGFKAAGLGDNEATDELDVDGSVLADRFQVSLDGNDTDTTDTDGADDSDEGDTWGSSGDTEEAESSDESAALDEGVIDGGALPGQQESSSTESTETSESRSSASSAASEEPKASSTESSEEASTEPSAEPTQAPDAFTVDEEQANTPDPLSSPEAFAGAVIPLTAKLGGMALGAGVTWVKDTMTPQNIAEISLAGVTGGPEAAGVAAAAKFADTGKTFLEPASASGSARKVLTAVQEAGFDVPEEMQLAVDLSAWLSMTEHVAYGERAMLPDGRTAETAIQDWILDLAGTSADGGLDSEEVSDLVGVGADALEQVDFDSDMATSAVDAMKEATR